MAESYKFGEVVVNKEEKKHVYGLPDFVTNGLNRNDKIKQTQLKLQPSQKDRLAFILDNVFTKEECDELIALTETCGYDQALINIGGHKQQYLPDIRNNMRCILDDPTLADCIYQRILPFIPAVWNRRKVVSLNERLRFLRYDPPQFFASHYDGQYRRPNGEMSFITIQLYLNEGMEGGATSFLDYRGNKDPIACHPKIGRVLVFEHYCFHEGSPLIKGRKYTVRTDVMYAAEQTEPIYNANRDKGSKT